MAVYVEQVGDRVRREGRVAFSNLFDRTSLRSTIVAIFLAILELLRHHGFRAEQPDDFGEIWVMPPEETRNAAASDATDEAGLNAERDTP